MSYTGWIRMDFKHWKPITQGHDQLSTEELVVHYKQSQQLTLESVVLPTGLDPHPGYTVKD